MALPAPSPSTAALVTGASSGIGVDLARELAGRGHNVVLVARRADRLEALAAELREAHGVRAEALSADLIDPEAVAALPARVAELGLDIDILINNAGYGSAGQFVDLDGRSESDMVRLNCEAVVALSHAYAPAMVERGAGAILIVASSAGFQPIPGQATYGGEQGLRLELRRGAAHRAVAPGRRGHRALPGPGRHRVRRARRADRGVREPAVVRAGVLADCAKTAIDGAGAQPPRRAPGAGDQGAASSRRATRRTRSCCRC